MKHILATAAVCAIAVGWTTQQAFAQAVPTSATHVEPHWYDTQSIRFDTTGAFMSMSFGDLTSNFDPNTNANSFIDKEMWVNTDESSPGQWVEAGDTDGNSGIDYGSTTLTNQRGSFCAGQFFNGTDYTYSELQMTPNQSGVQTIEFGPQSGSTTGWTVYEAGTATCLLPNTTQTAVQLDAGMESTDSANTFVDGTTIQQLEYVAAAGGFADWPSPSVLTVQNQTRWTSVFSADAAGGNATLTFHHP